jgi:hypothetical protein
VISGHILWEAQPIDRVDASKNPESLDFRNASPSLGRFSKDEDAVACASAPTIWGQILEAKWHATRLIFKET